MQVTVSDLEATAAVDVDFVLADPAVVGVNATRCAGVDGPCADNVPPAAGVAGWISIDHFSLLTFCGNGINQTVLP